MKETNNLASSAELKRKYREYQVSWMSAHGYSLDDFVKAVKEYAEDCHIDSFYEAYEKWQEDNGFNGFKNGEMWVCYDEWVNCEYTSENLEEPLAVGTYVCVKEDVVERINKNAGMAAVTTTLGVIIKVTNYGDYQVLLYGNHDGGILLLDRKEFVVDEISEGNEKIIEALLEKTRMGYSNKMLEVIFGCPEVTVEMSDSEIEENSGYYIAKINGWGSTPITEVLAKDGEVDDDHLMCVLNTLGVEYCL